MGLRFMEWYSIWRAVLKPRPLSVWLDPLEVAILASLIMYSLTLVYARENNRLLRALVKLHETKL